VRGRSCVRGRFVWCGVCLVCLVKTGFRTNETNQINQTNQTNVTVKITRFEDLDCWKEARQLARQVYEAIRQNNAWQRDIRLCGQVQAAAGSVMSNIAEGFVRRSNKEFLQFLFIAMSSAAEVQSHMYIAIDQGYVVKDTFESIYSQAAKTARLISGLITYLRTRTTRQTRQTRQTE